MRLLLLASFFVCSTAMAQDETDPFKDLLEEDEDPDFNPAPVTPAEPSNKPELDDPEEEELDFEDAEEEDAQDLLEEDPNATENLGGDSAEIYRATLAKVEGLDPDDEMQTWDEYIKQYPNTAFRAQIDARMATLEDAMYDTRHNEEPAKIDANKSKLKFSQGLMLENINPRQRIQVMLEWGLPAYGNLGLDYEHPIVKSFSVHGGLRRRFSGFSIEAGAHWALVRSARTKTLVTLIADVHVNASPAFFGFRPQIAFGKSFGNLDIQAQAGVDMAPRGKLDLRYIGGANLTFRASKAIAIFAETSVYMKNQSGDAGLFRFNQATFGLKFFPLSKNKDPDKVEVNLGASVPYSSAYWAYHFGSIMGQGNIYLD